MNPSRPRSRPLPGWLDVTLGPIAQRLYLAELARRNRRYDRGVGVERLPVPVISVGNLSVGGTGKTPMVAHLARSLRQAGRNPCIAMRGYKASVEAGSDEADEYQRLLGDIPIVAQPQRAQGVRALMADPDAPPIDCVLLDDGFQHRRLARDLDIVLIDATRSPLEDRPIPRGWLREPLGALKRADAVVVTRADLAEPSALDALRHAIDEAHGRAPVAGVRAIWRGLRIAGEDGADTMVDLDKYKGSCVLLACAIGNPQQLVASCERDLEPRELGVFVRPDHDPYTDATVAEIIERARAIGADLILTTEKDWSKLRRIDGARWPAPVARPALELDALWGGGSLEALVNGAASSRYDQPDGHAPADA